MINQAKARLLSLDALRGFNMIWIMGADAVVHRISELVKQPQLKEICAFFSEHVEWEGFHFYDMIFPLFLFIIGVTIPLAFGEKSPRSCLPRIFKRAAVLVLLGLIYNGLLRFDSVSHIRIFGVLPRLATGYLIGSIAYLYLKPKQIIVVVVAILLGYWALLGLVPINGRVGGLYSPDGNFANYVDRQLFSWTHLYERYGDPEGLISDIPAIATALLGVLCGTLLTSQTEMKRKAWILWIAGALCILAGVAWSPLFPIIKKIWTSSYVLVAGGASMMLLATFYYVVEVREARKWTLPLVVVGLNPITIYFAAEIVPFENVSKYFLGGLAARSGLYSNLLITSGTFLAAWLFLYFLYKKNVFLKV